MALTMRSESLIIGICGGSGSGKTTLADALCRRLSAAAVLRISHDSYYRDLSRQAASRGGQVNFDHPDALDTDALVRDLKALCGGREVTIPRYDFVRHRRAGGDPAAPKPVILLEGILIFTDPRLRALQHIKVFVDVDSDLRLARRLERDVRERGRDAASVLDQYRETVRPMHRQFVWPSRDFADLIVTDSRNGVVVDLLAARVREHLRGEEAGEMTHE